MKALSLLVASLMPLTASPENPLIPETWFQEITATDGSTQQCIIFTTVPGVEYTFYHSNDLASWTEVEKTYGLGQEFAAAMRETVPAPPPVDPQNPPQIPEPLVSASITIAPSSGAAGGTVVSWASLDHGNAVRHLIPATMAAEWSSVPIFTESYGTHWFAILPSSASVTPPEANNGFLGQNDAAMIADLEAGFASFNQAVTSSVITALKTPPPSPPAPDSKGFYRIKADWSLDSDGDGSPDHLELAIAARQAAAEDGLTGDPFDADTNDDGILDGNQLDADWDGIPDAKDIAPDEKLIAYEIIDLPRYALFEIDPGARQINDWGSVLYYDKVWKNGEHVPLNPGDGLNDEYYGVSINNHDQILGTTYYGVGNPRSHMMFACLWESPASEPMRIMLTAGGKTWYADQPNFVDEAVGLSVFSDDGEFLAHPVSLDPGDPPALDQDANYLWKLASGNDPTTAVPAPLEAVNLLSADVRWGARDDGMETTGDPVLDAPGGRAYIAGVPEVLPFVPYNIMPHSSAGNPDGHILMGYEQKDYTRIFDGTEWVESELLALAEDISTNGTAIGKSDAGILANGKWTPVSRMAPGLPESWTLGVTPRLNDTSPGGWILAGNATNSAAMLPLRIEGRFTNSENEIVTEAVGVDDFSIGSSEPDLCPDDPNSKAVQDRIWIMTPLGGIPKDVIIDAPLHSSAPLKVSASGITFGGQAETEISESGQVLSVSAGSAATGSEVLLDLKMGSKDSISKPIGMKVMKGRTVKVTVYKIGDHIIETGEEAYVSDANLIPTEKQIEDYLTNVFKPQVNVTFSVKIKPMQVVTSVDHDSNGFFDYGTEAHTLDQKSIVDEAKKQAGEASGDTSIRVYLLGSRRFEKPTVRGVANILNRTAWVKAKLENSAREEEEIQALVRTICHEVGHIMIGEGHPSEGNSAFKGPAPLPGTLHYKRLMWGNGTSREKISPLLVKGEWDKIEEWLQNEEREERIAP